LCHIWRRWDKQERTKKGSLNGPACKKKKQPLLVYIPGGCCEQQGDTHLCRARLSRSSPQRRYDAWNPVVTTSSQNGLFRPRRKNKPHFKLQKRTHIDNHIVHVIVKVQPNLL
jgi:hypothetical protein